MLTISASQFKVFEDKAWDAWVAVHIKSLSELLPDVSARYAPDSWQQLVDGLLRRADLYGMTLACETEAYCYGSLTLGIGFESRPDLPWASAALSKHGEARAESLWDGFQSTATAPNPGTFL